MEAKTASAKENSKSKHYSFPEGTPERRTTIKDLKNVGMVIPLQIIIQL
jgi:hypothetical protein